MNEDKTHAAYNASRAALSDNRIREFSPLALAYIGDTVYDLYVRRYLVANRMGRPEMLHKRASGVVNARSQATAAKLLRPNFTDRESEIFRAGQNAKSAPPKNMSRADYEMATGLEAVIGYLHLRGMSGRIDDLFYIIIRHFFGEDQNARG